MPSKIRPNRLEVSDRFPMLGFTIRTDESPRNCEVTVASDAALFRPEAKSKRSQSNFYSSRAGGPIRVLKGESVFLVPPDVLIRFIGQEKLYFSLATFGDSPGSKPEIVGVPTTGSPYIGLRGFTGRTLRRLRILPNGRANGYGNGKGAELEWAGDSALPGMQPVVETRRNGSPNGSNGAPSGVSPASGETTSGPGGASKASALNLEYDDGYGPMPAVDDDASHGIDDPIPDDAPATAASLEADQETVSEYEGASRFVAASPNNYRAVSGTRDIEQIVIHITDGGSKINGTIGWFQNPNQKTQAGKPINVSAHYVVGQDGEIVQMVRNNDVAWHAHTANGNSIGIEHVANKRGLPPTDAQYCASAALVTSLCEKYGMPADRDHIRGHAEADPKTNHDCPSRYWDWDYYMEQVSNLACAPRVDSAQSLANDEATAGYRHNRSTRMVSRPPVDARKSPARASVARPSARAMEFESFSLNWDDVELVPQHTSMSCWAAAGAMIVGWRDKQSITDDFIAEISERTKDMKTGLPLAEVRSFAAALDLAHDEPRSYAIDELRDLLETYGPLWVGIQPEGGGGHAVVVVGMRSDGAPDGSDTFVRIADPWDRVVATEPSNSLPTAPGDYLETHESGSRYVLSWSDFVREYEGIAGASTDGTVNAQIIHSKVTGGREPNRGAPSAYGMTAPSKHRTALRSTASSTLPRSSHGRAMDAGGAPPSPVHGTMLERVRGGKGAVTWQLDQLAGLKHPNDQPPAGGGAIHDGPTVRLAGWPFLEEVLGERVGAAFTIDWQYTGSSLGNVVIANSDVADLPGWNLDVDASVLDDSTLYPLENPTYAGLTVRLRYVFTKEGQAPTKAVTTVHLFGNGSYDQTSRWE